MAFVLSDEATEATDKILDSFGQGAKAFSPSLWRWEVANVLLMAERRKRLTVADANRHLLLLQGLPVEIDDGASREAWSGSLALSRKHQITVYDAAYLELALRRNLPLGTLDGDLRKAAKAEGVKLLPDKL